MPRDLLLDPLEAARIEVDQDVHLSALTLLDVFFHVRGVRDLNALLPPVGFLADLAPLLLLQRGQEAVLRRREEAAVSGRGNAERAELLVFKRKRILGHLLRGISLGSHEA